MSCRVVVLINNKNKINFVVFFLIEIFLVFCCGCLIGRFSVSFRRRRRLRLNFYDYYYCILYVFSGCFSSSSTTSVFSVLLLLDRGVTYPHSTAARRTRFEGKYTLGLSITTKTKLGGGKQHTAHTAAFKTHNVARNLTHTLPYTHARSYGQPNHSLPHIDTLVKNTEHAHLTKHTHTLTH